MRYTNKRQYIWSANIAYLLGLMASDGCLSPDGRHLDFTSKDLEQLHNFNSALGRNIKISPKYSSGLISGYRVQFSDVALYDFLQCAGLFPNKSKSISIINVPSNYYRDFLRGIFDGDGSVYGYRDKRWKNSLTYYVTFYSASEDFLHFIRKKNQENFGIKGSISTSARVLRLQYAKRESKILYNNMYYSTNCISLERKKSKLYGFIKNANSGKM